MFEEAEARDLKEALQQMARPGDCLAQAALPGLARLAAAGHRLEIDLAASAAIGVPVVLAHARPPDFSALTRRQREVAEALMRGASNREISADLGITEATAKDHVHAVLSRLGLKRRGEILRLAGLSDF